MPSPKASAASKAVRAAFTIAVDVERSLVRIAMSGFFEREDIGRFLVERHEAHARLRCGPNEHLTLNDLREMKIQSQEAVAEFQAMLGAPEYRSKRLAFVVSPTLARSQLLRALDGRDARCFETIASAEAWLLPGQGVMT